jgi:hypothetical protein
MVPTDETGFAKFLNSPLLKINSATSLKPST